jgi:DNA-binding NarL/FixJ family response regulator
MAKLTQREIDVYTYLCKGLSILDIADTLCISVTTARTYKSQLFKKKDVHSVTELLARRIQELELALMAVQKES